MTNGESEFFILHLNRNRNHLGSLHFLPKVIQKEVLVVKMEGGKEVLLPVIDEVVLKVDLLAGVVHVRLLPGLLP